MSFIRAFIALRLVGRRRSPYVLRAFALSGSRETVKATVFGAHIAPPTMTLEEFGDLEKADALAREAQKPEDGAAHANRR